MVEYMQNMEKEVLEKVEKLEMVGWERYQQSDLKPNVHPK